MTQQSRFLLSCGHVPEPQYSITVTCDKSHGVGQDSHSMDRSAI
jgi:hypothetical protein